ALWHVEERERRVTAVADEMDVLRVGEETIEQVEVTHVHRGLVAPARLAGLRGVRLEDRRDGVSRGHLRLHMGRDVLGRQSPRADRGHPCHVVEERIPVRDLPVPAREQRYEERLVGDGQARGAVEDDPQERRPRTAHAEQDQRRRHLAARTSTAARAACPPTVTYRTYAPGVSGARSTSTWRRPKPRRPAKSQPYAVASVETRTENRFP